MYYNGFCYSLPTDKKGVGKKIKGKTLIVTATLEDGYEYEVLKVLNWEIKKS